MTERIKVTNKELDVLQALWESDVALSPSQICDTSPAFVMSSVQNNLKNLQKKNLIEQGDIIRLNMHYTRTFQPTMTKEAFILNQYPGMDILKFMEAYQKQEG
ncbi:hypothetical protein [Fundicoccus culcitae]|uniref:MarR family transcriptional regulator n=1 Tax=Fundicoccus culcitae TaxID=2969821 RepID=A0ABY5P556_9LACT|nr:hypothetical protein [Fundicoccus culcitae]UUX33558.1 hypothetical protein NRE15_11715 [Fundicoccus culcitae]